MAQSKAHGRLAPHAMRRLCALALTLALVCGAAAVVGGCGGGSSSSPGHTGATAAHGTGGAGRGVRAGPAHPNIVFVLTDDLAWNLVRYMPHVRAMQGTGETFGNYFVTDSLCCPSRASILTGRFPHDTRVFDNSPPEGGYAVFHRRGEEAQTFAVALQRAGYRTALMGKYLNGYKAGAREGTGRPYVPPGWSEWDGVGNGYPEYGYKMTT
jgi:N-acetylglucosamine-6-sulfatase